jgi:hypothetical protein
MFSLPPSVDLAGYKLRNVGGSSRVEVVHLAVQRHGGVGGSLDSIRSVWSDFDK